ncbi:MAG: NUDIX hydrolase, partial [Nitrospinales bacterium]
ETLEDAAKRKVKEELGIKIKLRGPAGYYEEQYLKNPFKVESGLHTLSVVFLATPLSLKVKLDEQSAAWKFSKQLPKELKIKPFLGKTGR